MNNTAKKIDPATELTASINGLADYDFTGPQGSRTDIYLDPEDLEVRTFQIIGSSGVPMPAYHNRWSVIMHVDHTAVAQSVVDALLNHVDGMIKVVAAYRGPEWDGSNLIGQWADGVSEVEDDLVSALDQEEIASYWDAGDYFNGDSWERICDNAEVDPAKATIEQITQYCEGAVDPTEYVSGIAEWVTDQHQTYLDECADVG